MEFPAREESSRGIARLWDEGAKPATKKPKS